MDRRRSSQLIPEIYEATVNPELWDHVVEQLAELTNSKFAGLYYIDKDLGIANTVAQYGSPVDLFLDYEGQFNKIDALFDKAKDNSERGEVLSQLFFKESGLLCDLENGAKGNSVNLESNAYHLGRIKFFDSSAHKAVITFMRNEEAGAWEKGDIRVINEMVPHFKRALNIHTEFTRLRLQQDALLKGLDRLVIGIILYDFNAKTVYINPTAISIIESHPALDLIDNQLVLSDEEANINFHETILNTAKIEPEDTWKQSIAIGVKHADSVAPLPLLITPMHAHLLTSKLNHEGARVAVFLSDPNQQQPISAENLVSVYNLTPSEAQVAISIVNGQSIDEIAKNSCHSVHTIRCHLKATFKKMGVSRQSELIKLLLTGPFAHRRRSSTKKT